MGNCIKENEKQNRQFSGENHIDPLLSCSSYLLLCCLSLSMSLSLVFSLTISISFAPIHSLSLSWIPYFLAPTPSFQFIFLLHPLILPSSITSEIFPFFKFVFLWTRCCKLISFSSCCPNRFLWCTYNSYLLEWTEGLWVFHTAGDPVPHCGLI